MYKYMFCYFVSSFYALTTNAQSLRDVTGVTVISSSISHPETLRDSITIFYFDKFTLFKVSKPQFSSTFSLSENNDFPERSQIFQQKTEYFAYRIKDNKGYKISEYSLIEINRDIDEFMEDKFVKWSLDISTIPAGSFKKIIDSTALFNHIETFIFNSKSSTNLPDSIFLYYGKKFNNVKFDLINMYSIWNDYKLEKIRFVYQNSDLAISKGESGHAAIEYFSELCSPSQVDFEIALSQYRLLLKKVR